MQSFDTAHAAKSHAPQNDHSVGSGDAEIKIYTLRRKDGYPSFQCAWYALGQRRTKTFAVMEAAKLFAQQTTCSLRNEAPAADPVSQRDFELMRACDMRRGHSGTG